MTPAQRTYLVMADGVLVIHFAFVAFVVLGLMLIWAGRWRQWRFVGNFWFRTTHLLAIGVVAAESLLGLVCPLTTWENQLRFMAGAGERYEGTFVQHWLHRIMFFEFDPTIFTVAYALFFLFVAVSVWLVPVRWPGHWRHRMPTGRASKHEIP